LHLYLLSLVVVVDQTQIMKKSNLSKTLNRNETKQLHLEACQQLFHLMKSSIGPRGFDKLMQDDLGDILLTNDGATILDRMNMDKQPAAVRLLRDLSLSQDDQSGDGTTSVVLLACELLRLCHSLIERQNIALDVVLDGLVQASQFAETFLLSQNKKRNTTFDSEILNQLAQQVLQSKYIRFYKQHFASLIVDAIQRTTDQQLKPIIETVLVPSKNILDSCLLSGVVLDISNITCPLQRMELLNLSSMKRDQVYLLNITSSNKIMGPRYNRNYTLEAVVDKEQLDVDTTALSIEQKYWNSVIQKRATKMTPFFIFLSDSFPYKTISVMNQGDAVFIIDNIGKDNIKRLERYFNLLETSLDILYESEDFINEIGEEERREEIYCIKEEEIADRIYLNISSSDKLQVSFKTIMIYGPSDVIVQEIDRALHDAIIVIEKILYPDRNVPSEDSNNSIATGIVGGGGNVEMNLWKALNDYSLTIFNSKLQLVLKAYADALLVIPRQLLSSILPSQQVEYNMSQIKLICKNCDQEWCDVGFDINQNRLCNVMEHGIIDSLQTKLSSIRLATEACIMIVRIDESIYCPPS
jgi:chaperonin GroEL (HSP60 family)